MRLRQPGFYGDMTGPFDQSFLNPAFNLLASDGSRVIAKRAQQKEARFGILRAQQSGRGDLLADALVLQQPRRQQKCDRLGREWGLRPVIQIKPDRPQQRRLVRVEQLTVDKLAHVVLVQENHAIKVSSRSRH